MINWSLYVITDSKLSRGRSHLEVIRAAIAGGATVVQYREKEGTTRRMIEEARALRELTRQAGVLFIVNDRVDIALAVDADGVHVGQDDMPASLARKLMGPGKIVGVSVDNLEQALQAERDGADYVGAGPIFATPTKPDAAPPIGLEGLAEICRGVSIPVIAIGGINAENAGTVIAAGAAGIAVVSAVVAAPDVEAAARRLREIVERTRVNAERR
ncbi:MAG: thiamine phosphate synthase [Anaerolineae bacterium]|nr:thiamine phosphate synthase [Anaerolineae bacterium]MCX8066919.1 thiamine phosphate synthase [Anaerolineae bacterium]MDW7991183.1 thiamine phosphate synthase [Anaerolineae bacterium]